MIVHVRGQEIETDLIVPEYRPFPGRSLLVPWRNGYQANLDGKPFEQETPYSAPAFSKSWKRGWLAAQWTKKESDRIGVEHVETPAVKKKPPPDSAA